jgi:hypothetical protein
MHIEQEEEEGECLICLDRNPPPIQMRCACRKEFPLLFAEFDPSNLDARAAERRGLPIRPAAPGLQRPSWCAKAARNGGVSARRATKTLRDRCDKALRMPGGRWSVIVQRWTPRDWCLAAAVMCHVSCVLLRPCHVSCRALEHSHGRNFQVCLISQPSLFYVILHGDWRQLKRGAQDALSRLRPLQTQPPTRSQPPTQPQLLPPRPHSPLLLPLLRAFLMPPRLPATRTGVWVGGLDGGREGRGMGGWMEEG